MRFGRLLKPRRRFAGHLSDSFAPKSLHGAPGLHTGISRWRGYSTRLPSCREINNIGYASPKELAQVIRSKKRSNGNFLPLRRTGGPLLYLLPKPSNAPFRARTDKKAASHPLNPPQ